MSNKTLAQVVADHPYPDYMDWWTVGDDFIAFMQNAIVGEWRSIDEAGLSEKSVDDYFVEYVDVVYSRQANPDLIWEAIAGDTMSGVQSGEFDALSYAFYRSAYELLAQQITVEAELARSRRAFTRRVGRRFFDQLSERLFLELPSTLSTKAEFETLQTAIAQIGGFLESQQYLRDHFAFRFDVDLQTSQGHLVQQEADVVTLLHNGEQANALYEMGYPIILPSAVYLFHLIGEAQHHSSRIIEELFRRIGYSASETDDFDPTGFPSDLVVEFWQITASMDS